MIFHALERLELSNLRDGQKPLGSTGASCKSRSKSGLVFETGRGRLMNVWIVGMRSTELDKSGFET